MSEQDQDVYENMAGTTEAVDPRYEMVKNVCYSMSKRRDVVSVSKKLPGLNEKAHPAPESKEETNKPASGCGWRVSLAVLLCISIFFAISSLAVAVFAVISVKSLQRQCTGAEAGGSTQEVQGTVKELFDDVNRTQAQVRVLAEGVEELTVAQSNINKMIMEANRSLSGPPGNLAVRASFEFPSYNSFHNVYVTWKCVCL